MLARLQLVRRQPSQIRTRDNDTVYEFRMIAGEKQRYVCAVAVPNDIDWTDFECLYHNRRVVGHELVG